MRAGVLLSLRDQHGAGLLPVFHAAGVSSLRQVSDALGMKPDELAAIWAHLPWDDRAIGRRLGMTGLQVLNLRTAARSRLLRALAFEDEADDHAPSTCRSPSYAPTSVARCIRRRWSPSTITSRTARPAARPWPGNPTRRSGPRRSAGRWRARGPARKSRTSPSSTCAAPSTARSARLTPSGWTRTPASA